MAWRQTHGCDPNGRRDRGGDSIGCDAPVPAGHSGFCECEGGEDGTRRRIRLTGCDHSGFTCRDECARASHYFCDGWKQTGNCTFDGPREPARDLPCGVTVPAGVSGYCECGGGVRRVARPAGCSAEESGGVETDCETACGRGEGLYELLGLPESGKDASDAAIKSSFRRLSLKLHPDKQRTAEQRAYAALRFGEVRAAYDVLMDPDAKILYDMHGHQAAKDKANKQREQANQVDLQVTMRDVYSGGDKQLTISRRVVCKGCSNGAGGANRARCRRCGECPPEMKPVNVQVAPGFVVQQTQQVRSEERCEQQHYVINAKVPKGARDGDVLTFARAGEQRPGMIPGDVQLRLRVQPDARFKRVGSRNLQHELTISLRESLLGFTVVIPHLDGHAVKVERRGVTKPGATLQIAHEGLSRTDDDGVEVGEAGSLLVRVSVAYPDAISAEAQRWAEQALPP